MNRMDDCKDTATFGLFPAETAERGSHNFTLNRAPLFMYSLCGRGESSTALRN